MTRPHQAPADWLVPDWPAPAGVHALCTTRMGGVSLPPYDQLNLGDHVGDDAGAVQANRNTLQSALQAYTSGARATFLSQVHGNGVVHLAGDTPDGTVADACVTGTPGVVCTIMVADCLPVLLAHGSGAVVGAAHAGWRGLAGTAGHGVLESIFERFCALPLDGRASSATKYIASESDASHGTRLDFAKGTLAWLGPCIGPQAFEVGAEVRAAFCEHDPGAQHCFVPHPHVAGKYRCDLAGLARRRLHALGITQVYGNDSTAPWCTVANASRFFSHRRDSAALGGSGRFAACIWLG